VVVLQIRLGNRVPCGSHFCRAGCCSTQDVKDVKEEEIRTFIWIHRAITDKE
jgi:hypothetical protein